MSVKLIVKTDTGDFLSDTRHLEFQHGKDRAEAVRLVETVAGAPKDDEPAMFSIGHWQVYAVPTGDRARQA